MKKYFKRNVYLVLFASTLFIQSNCKKTSSEPSITPVVPVVPTGSNDVAFYLTKADQSVLLQQQAGTLSFGTVANNNSSIDVDSSQTFQTIDGFGYTLTGGSAYLINGLPNADKATLLNDLFSPTSASSVGISYLRVSLGASDLSTSVFSYNDLPTGQTDVNVANFSLSQDTIDVIPILKQIIAINPNIKIMASPWSAPTWMKDNNNSIGGSLQTQYYAAYAKYFVKYIQAMKAVGITIDAITIQNEPEYGGNNPSMLMTAAQQTNFIKNNLGPAFAAAAITTKIIVFDHNCDNPSYPISVMNDVAAKPYINGSAFHLYGGNISAMSTVHNAHPDKNLYFTEQWTGANGAFDVDFKWNLKNVVMGSMLNWSKVALQWNLASSPTYTPHTNGGCTECKGALTINGLSVSKNVAYFTIAQLSKFVPSGSVRIQSSGSSLTNVSFLRQDGKKVLVVLNEGATNQTFNIRYKGKWVVASLPANAAGTFIW
jgi:glucosylceramidase